MMINKILLLILITLAFTTSGFTIESPDKNFEKEIIQTNEIQGKSIQIFLDPSTEEYTFYDGVTRGAHYGDWVLVYGTFGDGEDCGETVFNEPVCFPILFRIHTRQ